MTNFVLNMTRVPMRKITVFLLMTVLAIGCSSEKTTFVSRNYHTLVSYFNGYYHAMQRYKEGVKNIEKKPVVPQTGFISLLSISSPQDAQSSYGLFDEANKKLDVLIFRHKNGRWVDDSYLLKGMIAFQKANYYEAMINFEYVLTKFPKSDLHPAARMWIAKAQLMAENPYRANELIKQIRQENPDVDKRLRPDIAELEVTLMLQQQLYNEALTVLEQEYQYVKGIRRKARWQYLMGQLSDERGSFPKALAAFEQVVKLNASNDMSFRAKLQIIELYLKYQPNDVASTETLTKMLKKMARDGKYKEYRDQIYYRYALLEEKSGNYPKAQEYLRRSLRESKNNPTQKTLSYYRYAEISFHKQNDLTAAQAYYDSAATAAPKEFPDRDRIITISKTLKEYVTYKNTLQLQDSLLNLARMSPEALEKFLKNKVEQEEEDKVQKLEELREAQLEKAARQANEMNTIRNEENFTVSSDFKFDDPNQVARGNADFARIWGVRNDEDNWRRSNKTTSIGTTTQKTEEIAASLKPSTPEEMAEREKKYKENVPTTAEKRAVSDSLIAGSLWGLALLFDQKLMMTDSAVIYYQKLIDRYPKHELVPKALYSLYQVLKERDPKDPKIGALKQRILTEYPNSIYAKLLKQEGVDGGEFDPDYDFQESYKNLYNLYEMGDWPTSEELARFLIAHALDHPEIPKVYYILGMIYGKQNKLPEMKEALGYLVQNWPDSDQGKSAAQTLRYLGVDVAIAEPAKDETEDKKATPTENPAYIGFNDRKGGEAVAVVMLVEQTKIKNTELEVMMANFQKEFFSSENYRAVVFSYTGKDNVKFHMVYITKFMDYNIANNYIGSLKTYQPASQLLDKEQDKVLFFMTMGNFKVAFQQRRFEDYAQYYKAFKDEMIKGKK